MKTSQTCLTTVYTSYNQDLDDDKDTAGKDRRHEVGEEQEGGVASERQQGVRIFSLLMCWIKDLFSTKLGLVIVEQLADDPRRFDEFCFVCVEFDEVCF